MKSSPNSSDMPARRRKKLSQSAHHTMSELNITPLLVIFIITTAPAVNDIAINLPSAANNPKDPPPKINNLTVDETGNIFLNSRPMQVKELRDVLIELRKSDPDLSVVVRGDLTVQYQKVITVLDILTQANVNKVGLATEAAGP
jgi:biopolymer transport protein ExbD